VTARVPDKLMRQALPGQAFSPNEAKQRADILRMLRESLAEWEAKVDWEGLPQKRKEALVELARESASALRALIANFEKPSGGGQGV
jgi:hypothetical protein